MQIEEMKFLTDIEIEEMEKLIERNYGCKIALSRFVLRIDEVDKVRIVTKKFSDFDWSGIRINSMGLYFCKMKGGSQIQLSVEGSQMVGRFATRNIAVLDGANMRKFIQGFDVKVSNRLDCDDGGFVLVKSGDDFFGSGRLAGDTVENSVPKDRRTVFTSGRLE